MSKTKTTQLTPIADISADLAANELINVCAGPEGELYILLHRGRPNYGNATNGGIFARLQTDVPHGFLVFRLLRLGKPPRMEIARSLRFLSETGTELSGATYAARGAYLYILHDARVYRVRPSDFV